MNESTLNIVLELFEKHRKDPGAEYDQEHFFDYLMKQPSRKGAFRDSFSGLRRFNAFWDEVQLRFGVCFSIKDRESDYSLNEFCERVEELKQSKRSSKAALRNRAKYEFEWGIFIFSNIIFVGLAVALREIYVLSIVIWIGVFYLNYKLLFIYFKEKQYIQDLEARINSEINI